MEIMIQRTEQSGMGNLEETKATPLAVADLLAAGVAITPLQSINSSQARFVGADWVFVQIVGFQQHIQQLLDHPFTVSHASVVCLSEDNGSLSGVIGFALPQRIVSHTAYRDVQIGLALLYDGQPPKKVLEPIILNCGGNAAALDGNLDQSTVDRLVTLGQEDVFRRKQNAGVFRSSLLLEPGVSVETANGPTALASLVTGCKVSCPVHLDTTSQAEVIRSEGGVSGVLCHVCGRTYWAGRPRPGYDFKQFRKTFGELAASETPEPDGTRQFNLMNERYLTNPSVRQSIKEYLDERRELEGILFNAGSPLFKSQKGSFSPNTLQQLLRRLHDRAGIIGGRSHSGRRWFATELISRGTDIKAVSTLMGHSSISMTAQYVQDNPQRLRRIVAALV